jgi:hypothetical protein
LINLAKAAAQAFEPAYTRPSRRIGEVSGGTALKKVYLAYALLALVVIFLLYAQLSHAPA